MQPRRGPTVVIQEDVGVGLAAVSVVQPAHVAVGVQDILAAAAVVGAVSGQDTQ